MSTGWEGKRTFTKISCGVWTYQKKGLSTAYCVQICVHFSSFGVVANLTVRSSVCFICMTYYEVDNHRTCKFMTRGLIRPSGLDPVPILFFLIYAHDRVHCPDY